MISNPIIVDDVIPKSYQDLIEKTILENENFPWTYLPNITSNDNYDFNNTTDTYGIGHPFCIWGQPSNLPTYNFLLPLIHQACEKINFNLTEVFHGRIYMYFPTVDTNKKNMWHTDMPQQNHIACVYYVNNSTGPTVISSSNDRDCPNVDGMTLDTLIEVEPKKGRMVFFDGKLWHASSTPKNNNRCIINFDIG